MAAEPEHRMCERRLAKHDPKGTTQDAECKRRDADSLARRRRRLPRGEINRLEGAGCRWQRVSARRRTDPAIGGGTPK